MRHPTDVSLHRLPICEATIKRGFDTFVEVGLAFGEIREGRLYRETHATFEAYCQGRWGLTDRRVRQLMGAAEIGTMVPVSNERQARELAPLMNRPGAMAEAWAEANTNGDATAAKVREAVERRVAHVAHSTGESEWYTPAEYIAAAKAVMGGIDLDPATVPVANDVVGAAAIYTLEENGLTQPWAGRVWMNPPYAQPAVMDFCEKLARHYSEGEVTEACVLVNNATETRWFHTLVAVASAICFPLGRIRFWHPERDSATPLQGQAIIYIGPNGEQFRETFKCFGFTAVL